MSKLPYIILIMAVCLVTGCQQSSVSAIYDPNTGAFRYSRVGDMEVGGFSAILKDETLIEFDSSRSENLAYREGIDAARVAILKALDGLGAVKAVAK